ncbi:hypothetical protein [Streptomyces sp. NBC_01320]|uniref:hypothetical protein n=1 Tax=Streptomyces sp. NBC_01320 TaxID=2903824 RepID=UPI002E1064A8|nr:hypothetical protein OG395_05130 [Streptomyces sp. NBC_01320]
MQAGRDLGQSWPIVQHCFESYGSEVLPESPPDTSAIGIDETRRGKPVWKQNPDTEKWELVADAWHIDFVDAIGGRGLFGQVEGRNATSVTDWLMAQLAAWRAQVRYVAIGMCATFRAPCRTWPWSWTAFTSFSSPSVTSLTCAAASHGASTDAGPARAMSSKPSASSCDATRKISPKTNSPSLKPSWTKWALMAGRFTRPGRPRNSFATCSN